MLQPGGGCLDQSKIETIAQDFRSRGGLRPHDAELAPNIAAAVLGPNAIRIIQDYPTPATVIWVGASPIIYVRADATDPQGMLGHEMGHVALRWAGWRGDREAEERLASRIGVAIIAPADAVRRACHWHPRATIRNIARCFYITQTSAALRIAEVLREERAVVTRTGNVMIRTQGAFDWNAIDIVATARARVCIGLARTRLTGLPDRGRIALKSG